MYKNTGKIKVSTTSIAQGVYTLYAYVDLKKNFSAHEIKMATLNGNLDILYCCVSILPGNTGIEI